MNIVRLGMIVTLGAVAYYALTIYAAMPAQIAAVPQAVMVTCQRDGTYGIGIVFIALLAISGAITVAAVDLWRRVY